METKFDHQSFESKIYEMWEKSGAFSPKVPNNPKEAKKTKKPFSIILPPPNANEPLHAGHALYTVEDIMVRYHRMLGEPTLWLPGTDHAGIETQFVYEKHLKKEGKSRFDFDRETLYKMIGDYVNVNRDTAKNQMKRLGFSLDWTREKFTLDEEHNQRIFAVFGKMIKEDLIYRDEKIVNYCTFCGTAFSNLEVEHKNVSSHLWYIKYGPLTVATTRPETMLGDTAVAVNPKDKRYKDLIGKQITLPLVMREITVIGDETVDPKFGTGAVKVTPSHSTEDYEMAKKHDLEMMRIFDYDGRANENVPEKYRGLFPNQVRSAVIEDLEREGLLEKIEDYAHEVGHCYKCGRAIEPITAPQWFVKIKPLAQKAEEVVKSDKVLIFPKRFKKAFLTWMKDIRDWPISRQIIWGHRIPIWYNLEQNSDIRITFIDKKGETKNGSWKELKGETEFEEIKKGLQSLVVPVGTKYYLSEKEALENGNFVLQETDTFDTWFSSGQWPYSTLGWSPEGKHSPDFDYFYPTTVLDTMWDILFFWVARMIMMGIYATGEIPFEVAHMHSRVVDGKGAKMSKSKGNVIDPISLVDQYGADALRIALVIGIAPGSDIPLSEDKVRAGRNFANKIWNASRFIVMSKERLEKEAEKPLTAADKEILEKMEKIIKSTNLNLERYRFGQAAENLYHFFWHDFCDVYIESTKNRGTEVVPILTKVLETSLKLLHPFMPFVTETIYQEIKKDLGLKEEMLISASWPI
jgi:valyl-tRNA synthetase